MLPLREKAKRRRKEEGRITRKLRTRFNRELASLRRGRDGREEASHFVTRVFNLLGEGRGDLVRDATSFRSAWDTLSPFLSRRKENGGIK